MSFMFGTRPTSNGYVPPHRRSQPPPPTTPTSSKPPGIERCVPAKPAPRMMHPRQHVQSADPYKPSSTTDSTTAAFFAHGTASRVHTDGIIASSLRKQYPQMHLTIANSGEIDLLAFAAAGHASYTQLVGREDDTATVPDDLKKTHYIPPPRNLDDGSGSRGPQGFLWETTEYGKYLYVFEGVEFILYIVSGRDGVMPYTYDYTYILSFPSPGSPHPPSYAADRLLLAAGQWATQLRNEIWVFDQGYWQRSAELFESVRHASWDDVILDPEMKRQVINDCLGFFNGRDTYKKLKVPWKRGVIFYGPPGNGKTVSVKAMMRSLWDRKEGKIPSLYVRSLRSWGGPEMAISEIFKKAREYAPCYLIFEDLDSLIDDSVRSYFLNEVDGLKNNDGICIVGSTNHLERLDPGLSKRPSRFDRKYLFPDPDLPQRVAYCKYWQGKLKDNKEIEFPDKLCEAVAGITDGFSFAYIQEAFVASLLAIAGRGGLEEGEVNSKREEYIEDDWVGVDGYAQESVKVVGGGGGDDDELEDNVLWVEIQKQVAILREGMEDEEGQQKVLISKFERTSVA